MVMELIQNRRSFTFTTGSSKQSRLRRIKNGVTKGLMLALLLYNIYTYNLSFLYKARSMTTSSGVEYTSFEYKYTTYKNVECEYEYLALDLSTKYEYENEYEYEYEYSNIFKHFSNHKVLLEV